MTEIPYAHRQIAYSLRMDWGPTGAEVIGVSLRNRQAAAEWLVTRRDEHPALRVAVIAAGERWPDGSLRPAVEDQWGAGAQLDSKPRHPPARH